MYGWSLLSFWSWCAAMARLKAAPNLESLAERAFGLVPRIAAFAATLILKILELVKNALLGWLSEHAHSIPGFHLLTVILGQNPFTGEVVLRTAENLIKGFITLMPGGEETYEQLGRLRDHAGLGEPPSQRYILMHCFASGGTPP